MDLTRAVDRTIATLRADAPDYLGSGVVDLTTGMLLGVDTVDQQPRDVLDVLAAATADLFRGRRVRQIERMWHHQRADGQAPEQLQEVLMHSDGLVHLFVRNRAAADLVTAVICRRSANLGLLMSVGRQAASHLVAA